MLNGSRFTYLSLGTFIFACGVIGVLALWFLENVETTRVLGAFVEQTPEPSARTNLDSLAQDTTWQAVETQWGPQAKLDAAFGTIQEIQGSVLKVLTARNQTRVFETTAQTRYIVVGKTDAGLSDLAVGDKILILGTRDSTGAVGAVTPRVILAAPAAYTRANVLVGKIVRASDQQLVLTTASGTKMVNLANDVQAFGARIAPSAVQDLPTNVPTLILGEPTSPDVFNARLIFVVPQLRALVQRARNPQNPLPFQPARRNAALGTVTTVHDSKLEVQPAPPPARTLTLDANTKIIVVGKPNASAQDIRPGDKIIALGANTRNNTPRVVIAAPADYTRENVRLGRVVAAQENQITIDTPGGQLTVTVNAGTQIFDRHLNALGFDALKKQGVLVIGQSVNNAMQAQVILARTSP